MCDIGWMFRPRPPRLYVATDILSGRVNLDDFPFRYICVGPPASSAFGAGFRGRSGVNETLDQVFSAVELLETRGWELAGIDRAGTIVVLRRRSHGG